MVKGNMSAKLDWNQMLGFEQIPEVRDVIRAESSTLGAKVGQKTGTKAGLKAGVKIGQKVGNKVGVKRGIKA